jgi:hypothetical protein
VVDSPGDNLLAEFESVLQVVFCRLKDWQYDKHMIILLNFLIFSQAMLT